MTFNLLLLFLTLNCMDLTFSTEPQNSIHFLILTLIKIDAFSAYLFI